MILQLQNNGELFNTWYIDTYKGADFKGTTEINDKLEKLKKIQDTLAKMNKTLLLVFAPSKDLYSPENLPDGVLKGDSTNHDVFIKLAKQKGLNYIDFGTYFAGQKNKSPYPLFSKHGSHWSMYGSCIAGDSIISTLEKLLDIKMYHMAWKNTIVLEKEKKEELELEDELNLIFPLKHTFMGHPVIPSPPAKYDSTITRPSAMLIGDSYVWALIGYYQFAANFSSLDFCYYYNTLYYRGGMTKMNSSTFNLPHFINKNDIIIIEATESNLNQFGFGFIDEACKVFNIGDTFNPEFNKKVLEIKNGMKAKPEFMKYIAEKAQKNNITVDSALTLDAMWMVQHTKN